MLRLQKETRAFGDLAHLSGTLGQIKERAMQTIMPGDFGLMPRSFRLMPRFFRRRGEKIPSDEEMKGASIKAWSEYSFEACTQRLQYAMERFSEIAANPDLAPNIKAHYAGLSSAAVYFLDAFRMLKNKVPASCVLSELHEAFSKNQDANRVRCCFFAVENRLNSEIEKG
jgi:hypothetical protein